MEAEEQKRVNEQITSRLYRVYITAHEMLRDRGYVVPPQLLSMSLDDFKTKFGVPVRRAELTNLLTLKDEVSQQICLFFASNPGGKKLATGELKEYTEQMEKANVKRAVLVHAVGVTPMSAKILSELCITGKLDIELFEESKLLVNITKHILVPKHTVLSDAEKAQVLARYKLKETQLPRMQEKDPIAKYFGLRKGKVVKIVRPSETAGKYVTYRLVTR